MSLVKTINGEIVGDIGTSKCDSRNGTFILGLEIKEEHRRNGFAYEAVLLVLRYYFFALRYHKAWTGIYSFNKPSLGLFEKLGFVEEGIQKEMIFLNGEYFDKVLMGMTVDQFKKIFGKEYKI